MKRFLLCCTVLVLGLAVLGCGDTGMYRVTGTVTFEGDPVEEGRILFRKVDGDQRAYSGQITNGSYSVLCEEGTMRVEITASRPVPGKFSTANDVKEPVGEMYIPAKYNTKSELKVEVGASSRQHPFDLKK